MKCRICGCTYERGCPAGCSWFEDELCSVCARFRGQLSVYSGDALRVTKAGLARLLDEVKGKDRTGHWPSRRRRRHA